MTTYDLAHTLGFVSAAIKTSDEHRIERDAARLLTLESYTITDEDSYLIIKNGVSNKCYKLELKEMD